MTNDTNAKERLPAASYKPAERVLSARYAVLYQWPAGRLRLIDSGRDWVLQRLWGGAWEGRTFATSRNFMARAIDDARAMNVRVGDVLKALPSQHPAFKRRG